MNINVDFTDEQLEKLQEIAASNGISVESHLADYIQKYADGIVQAAYTAFGQHLMELSSPLPWSVRKNQIIPQITKIIYDARTESGIV